MNSRRVLMCGWPRAWQEKIERAAQKPLAIMCPACSRNPAGLLAQMESANRDLNILTASANLLRSKASASSASLGVLPSGREWIQKPDQRSRQRAEYQREA